MERAFLICLLAAGAWPREAFGAIGCTLTNPAEDLKYLYPAMTSYKEDLKEFPRLKDGAKLYQDFKARLSGSLDPIYETYETPYTIYDVFQGSKKIGVVHGVNVPGKGGVIQVFLSMDPETAEIRSFFYQRLESPAARQLRDKAFRAQFTGLALSDFYKDDYYSRATSGSRTGKIAGLRAPDLGAADKTDYEASLRGIRKNLVLLDFFVYGRRFEPFFERARKALGQTKEGKN